MIVAGKLFVIECRADQILDGLDPLGRRNAISGVAKPKHAIRPQRPGPRLHGLRIGLGKAERRFVHQHGQARLRHHRRQHGIIGHQRQRKTAGETHADHANTLYPGLRLQLAAERARPVEQRSGPVGREQVNFAGDADPQQASGDGKLSGLAEQQRQMHAKMLRQNEAEVETFLDHARQLVQHHDRHAGARAVDGMADAAVRKGPRRIVTADQFGHGNPRENDSGNISDRPGRPAVDAVPVPGNLPLISAAPQLLPPAATAQTNR
jgi:hypothetical protein